jgi:hypothetical protein
MIQMIRRLIRPIFLFSGVILLGITAYYIAPWVMATGNISVVGRPHSVDKLTALFQTLDIPVYSNIRFKVFAFLVAFGIVVATFLGILSTSSTAYRGVIYFFRSCKRKGVLLAALILIGATLIPTPLGWRFVIYFGSGSMGVLIFLWGVAPLLRQVYRLYPDPGSRILSFFSRMSTAFFAIERHYYVICVFLFVFIVTNLISFVVFNHIPHVEDSVAQTFHAKIFLSGKLTAPSPQVPEFFYVDLVINNGKWYSIYLPGHSLLLMFGWLIGAPWIINPILGSLAAILLYLIAKEMFDERTARLAGLLGTLSPFMIFMSSEFMNHATALFFTEVFILGFVRMMNRQKAGYGLLAGFALGYVLLIRPLTAISVGVPFAVYAAWVQGQLLTRKDQTSSKHFTVLLSAVLSFGAMAGVLLLFNYLTNGDPSQFAYTIAQPENRIGFGHGMEGPHTPLKGLVASLDYLVGLNKWLFEMPVPSMLFAVITFTSGRARRWDFLLAAYAATLLLAHFFYWYHAFVFGPRYMYEAWPALVILTARGVLSMPDFLKDFFGAFDRRRVAAVATRAFAFCLILGLAINVPVLVRVYSENYFETTEISDRVQKLGLKNALVFVRKDYNSVFPLNSPLLDGNVIYARDLGKEKNVSLMKFFPHRSYYIADGPEIAAYR